MWSSIVVNRLIPKFAAACGLLAFAAVTMPAIAQDLLVNGGFDSSLNGWQFPDAMPAWVPLDIDGSPGSGSAYYDNAQATGGTQLVVLSQCVPVTEAGAYLVTAYGLAATGQANGHLVGSYTLDLHHTDCSGGFSALGGDYIAATGQWEAFRSAAIVVSPPAPALMSINVLLRVDKTDAGGNFAGYFDAVSLIRDTIFMGPFD